MTTSMTPQYWEGWDQLDQDLAHLHTRLETMNDRWRWAVRMRIARLQTMLEARWRDEHYALARQDSWSEGEKRCVCGLQFFDAPDSAPFHKIDGHVNWITDPNSPAKTNS